MLSQEEVLRLYEELGDRKVLSVYLNGEETDPAERRAWRVRLGHMVKDLSEQLAAQPEEQASMLAALEHIEGELAGIAGLLPERGWVGFASPERLWYAGSSPAPMPDLVRWETSVHVTPYVRALKQSRPVVAVVADQRHARRFHYQYGALSELEGAQAEAVYSAGPSSASSKRPATRSGARGETRVDAGRRAEEASTQRMLREVLAALAETGDDGHLLVVGGSPEVAASLLRALPERARERAIEVSGLHVEASDAEIREAVDAAASALSQRLQVALVERVIEAARSDGRACLGRERTERALQAGAVETLVLSRRLSRAEPDFADRLVDLALARAAAVEEVAGAAADELDREGGVGARLRFAV